MKRLKSKKAISILLAMLMAMTMCVGTTSAAFATDSGDQEYLALGADLSDAEKATVLDYFGLDSTDGCEVLYVTNSEEHKYLDDYVDTDQIGSKALSSVLIKQQGSDENYVTTYNIGYCTEEMYESALETAGVTGSEVIVAGPFEISGTAALVGIIKAYEEMTGEDVSDEVIEGAVDELTTTGDLGEEIGDKGTAVDIISDVKEELADNPDMSAEEIEQAIKDAAADHNVTLSDESVQKVKDMTENLKGLDIDWGNLIDVDGAKGFFTRFVDWIKGLIG